MWPPNNGPQDDGSAWPERHGLLGITVQHRAGRVAGQDREERGPKVCAGPGRRETAAMPRAVVEPLPLGGMFLK